MGDQKEERWEKEKGEVEFLLGLCGDGHRQGPSVGLRIVGSDLILSFCRRAGWSRILPFGACSLSLDTPWTLECRTDDEK